MTWEIKLYQNKPIKIYKINNSKNQCLYISNAVFKKNLLKEIQYDQLDINAIYQDQKLYLLEISKIYLSKSEKSTMDFEKWLKKRMCFKKDIEEIRMEMIEQNFLNENRYINDFIEKKWHKGSKPLWIIKKELKQSNININIDEEKYNEIGSLYNFISTQIKKLKKDEKKYIQYLLRKGYKYSTIQEAIKKIKENYFKE